MNEVEAISEELVDLNKQIQYARENKEYTSLPNLFITRARRLSSLAYAKYRDEHYVKKCNGTNPQAKS